MTVERCHRWAAGRWERRDRVNRVSSSIPSTFSPSFLPSFLPRFAHARTRYVNSALERLFNGSRPRQRESGKKKKKRKKFTRLSLPVLSPVSGLEGGCSVDSLAPSFLSFSLIFFHSTRLDSIPRVCRGEIARGEGIYLIIPVGIYIPAYLVPLTKLCATTFYELPL